MLASLILPILIAAIAVFFASFLSWMVLQLHKQDWVKLKDEDAFIDAVRTQNIAQGSYMFPGCDSMEEMKSEAYQKKYEQGPNGIMTVLPKANMGRNLGLTLVYFAVVNFLLAYLGTMALPRGSEFMPVFRFIATAGVAIYLGAMVQHAIWFRSRIVGHVIESIAYAVISGVIFALMWPGAPSA